jgi:hypothetical protein
LSRAEFAHNAAVNKTICAAPFELTYGDHSRTSVGEVVEVVNAPEVLTDYWKRQAESRQGLERLCMLSRLSERYTDVPVLPTTPVSRLAHMGCSSKWLKNVVFLVCTW